MPSKVQSADVIVDALVGNATCCVFIPPNNKVCLGIVILWMF